MTASLRIQLISSIQSVDPKKWDSLTSWSFPFLDHGFLSALEASESIGAESGWDPIYVVVSRGEIYLGGCATFLKHHSYGEYIFDWEWANAAQRAGISYYPKLVVAVPFTPATGAKFLLAPGLSDTEVSEVRAAVEGAVKALAKERGANSIHWLFTSADETEWLAGRDYIPRLTHQFHWTNAGYTSFDDFLDSLKSRKRKQIHKERVALTSAVKAAGAEIQTLTGTDLDPSLSPTLYRLYKNTVELYGSYPYLTPQFFDQALERCRDSMVLFVLRQGAEVKAMSLGFRKGEGLFGRYWGAEVEMPFLHFELCYYRPIEWGIGARVKFYEAGAQGPHKMPRGFLPTLTYSAHSLHPQALHLAVERAVQVENQALLQGIESARQASPFREE